jgi:serine protease Do
VRIQALKPIVWLILFIMLIGLACGGPPAEEPTQVPEKDQVEQPTLEPTEPIVEIEEPTEEVESAAPEGTGAVSSIEDVRGAVIQIEAQGTFVDPEYGEVSGGGRGSGFIIDPSGIAVTNNHVVTGAALLKVWIGGDTSKTYNAKILGVSECSDLAVIDIQGDGFPYLEWYNQPVKVGLDVYTAGFPLGEPEYTLTKGIVSKESADGETNWASVDSVIMHDATINPGNSGGPLVTEDGKVVAVNYGVSKSTDQYFAIGQDVAIPVIEKLREGQDVNSLGINGVAFVSDDGTFSGVWVNSVEAGSPASEAGVKGGDIVRELQGFPIATDGTMSSYCDIVRTHKADDTVNIMVYRYLTAEDLEGQLNGKPLEVVATYNDSGDAGDTGDSGDAGVSGEFMAVSDDLETLYVEIPSTWKDIYGSLWEGTWRGNISFNAPNIIAAPDLDEFNNYWGAPGVDFAASADWGNIGGYVNLLDDAAYTWYEDSCEKTGRYDYEDTKFEGRFDIWDCGVDADVIVLAARPIADPLSYLVLLQIQLGEDWGDSDGEVETHISDTFDVIGTLP